ncbi:phospholipase-like protein [Tanacetum coccineum]
MLGRQIFNDENENDENVPLYYQINNDLSIPFGREEFCLVTGLRFGVQNWAEYDTKKRIPFRRRVFPSYLDGQPITGIDIENMIDDQSFAQLYDDDAVGLCCLGILQLVILGVESKRVVPDWMLRLANDRIAWDKYPWGSYVWPTLYSQIRNAIVKRWSPLYVDEPTNEDDSKKYSIFGYTWAFKTWILESYRVTATRFFDRYNRYPRVAAWNKKKGRFLGRMVIPFFEFNEQKREIERNKEEVDNIKEEMRKFKEEMNDQPVRQENKEPIIADEHYGLSDFSQFHSMQGGLSSFQRHVNSSYFNMGTPPIFQTPMPSQPGSSVWQTQMPAQSATNLSHDTGKDYKEVERLEKMGEDGMPILQMAEESCKKCLISADGVIGSGLKKHFEDGVVKREENLQPTQEVEIARHASRGNWRREKRKNKPGFKLPAYVMMSIERMLTHSCVWMHVQVGSGTAPRVGHGATASEAPHCCDRKRPSQQPTLPNNEQISQMGLQSLSIRLAEMRIKRRDSGQRMHHMLLPQDLRESVRSYDQYKWLTVTNFKIRGF